MINGIFFGLGLVFWGALAWNFGAYYVAQRNPLDVVAAIACLLAALGPARELKLIPNWAAAPIYVLGLFVCTGGLGVVLVFLAQRRRGHR